MDEQQAKQILGERIQSDGGLEAVDEYLAWTPSDDEACLDGNFTADELEAIAVWMRADGYRHGAQT